MEHKKEKISVIIPTRNRTQPIIDCLNSISIQTELPDEIIIVDSSEKKDLENIVKSFKKLKIKYFHTDKAGGTYQRNLGAKKSSGDIIIFSDDDAIWDKNYLKEIVSIFRIYSDIDVGGVTGNPILKKVGLLRKFFRKASQIFFSIFLLPRPGSGKFQLSGTSTWLADNVNRITQVEFLYGFSMAFKKKIFEQFWLDEHFSGYVWNDDDDLAYRISRKYPIFFAPSARILHNPPRAVSDRNDFLAKKKIVEYHHYFFKKNLEQDLMHKTAFWWSIFGFSLIIFREGLLHWNFKGLRGFFSGLKNILNEDDYN
jgi:glycosyltransferase involved in cell wall biosynthesis